MLTRWYCTLLIHTRVCKVLETWLWMGLVFSPWTGPNHCTILSGGDLPHKSYLLPTECSCVTESGYGVHNTFEYTLAHVYWEWSNWLSICDAASAACAMQHMELRLFSLCYSTILCKQQHQDYSCTSTGVSCGILSHFSHRSLRLKCTT